MGARLLENFLGARRSGWIIFSWFFHICFYLLSCWFIFPSFPLHVESIFYICFNLIILTITFCLFFHSPLFKFINNLFLKCGAFNIQAYKHFWEKDCIGFSLFKIFSKKKTRKIFRGNWLLQISGRSALGARRSGQLLFGSYALGNVHPASSPISYAHISSMLKHFWNKSHINFAPPSPPPKKKKTPFFVGGCYFYDFRTM